MKASRLFVNCLESEGVDYVFGVPGEENIDLLESIDSSKIRFILTRHESGAAFMANVYGRLTHKPGVCLSTLGPGATNMITGIADAYLDKAPLVGITAQSPLEAMHKESHQYIDSHELFKSITAWSKMITRAELIPEIVRKAFDIAVDRSSPVHIELPEDIACEELKPPEPLKRTPHSLDICAMETIKKAAEAISRSSSCIILAGNGVIRSEASKALLEFASSANIPVATTFMGKGAIPADSELCIGTVGLQARDYAFCGLEKAVMVIAVGYDCVEYFPKFWNPNGRNKRIIHIHTSHPEIDADYMPAFSLAGDISENLRRLGAVVKKKKIESYFFRLRDIVGEELSCFAEDRSFPLRPQRIVYEMREALGRDDIVVSDVGAHKLWIARLYPAYEANTVIISNGFSSMGISIPGAMAAKFVCKERKVIAACGDGGFLMSAQEIETAIRNKINLVILIFNDSKYGLIEMKERQKFRKSFSVDFKNPDFSKLASSFGAEGIRIEKAEQLGDALKEALKMNKLCIIDVPVDYSENITLMEKLGNNICRI